MILKEGVNRQILCWLPETTYKESNMQNSVGFQCTVHINRKTLLSFLLTRCWVDSMASSLCFFLFCFSTWRRERELDLEADNVEGLGELLEQSLTACLLARIRTGPNGHILKDKLYMESEKIFLMTNVM